MQLDLFSDNFYTIRLNEATELLHALRLEEALAIYTELLADAPEDAELLTLRDLVVVWLEKLALFDAAPDNSERLHNLWLELTPDTPPALAAALCKLLINKLLSLPWPELIYIPPRFHLGTLLLARGNFTEAEHWFTRAIESGIDVRGRFLAWRGDALTKLGNPGQAKEAYLAAFLEGPHEVDLESLQSPLIHDLIDSLENEEHNFGAEDLLTWLPVWGWLQGAFALPMKELAVDCAAYVKALDAAHSSRSMPVARLWFDDLRYVEYLRTAFRDDRELLRIRRRMQQSSRFMFERYMEKLRSRLGEDLINGQSWQCR
jgi:tetratricopeptide (TPR) repeat protein